MFKLRERLKSVDVILASQSPRRRELLGVICDNFRVVPAKGEEIIPEGLEIEEIPRQLALNKCREIAEKNVNSLVIGCDTVVVLGDRIMGKPENDEDAYEMLRALSGQTHRVMSGTAVYCEGEYHSFVTVTEVSFKELSDRDIYAYIATGEPADKAGAYGIQGQGCLLVKGFTGDYFNVVGLPVSELADKLATII